MANIASALRGATHITAIGDATVAELATLPTEALLMYVVDTAPVEALYYLAEQFGVTGWGGWALALSEADRRVVVKGALRLQRIKGTPAAIKQILAAAGFPDAVIRENIGQDLDGSWLLDGSVTLSGGTWATFRVSVGVGNGVTIDAALVARMRAVIEEYKNARSHLSDVSLTLTFADALAPTDLLEYDDNAFGDNMQGLTLDGTWLLDGGTTFTPRADAVAMRVFRNGILIENGNY